VNSRSGWLKTLCTTNGGFLGFLRRFFAANCANDANGPHSIAHTPVIAGGPFASFAQFAAQILVAACRAVL